MKELPDSLRERAYELWDRGWTLGEIAKELGCSPYALSPWIYASQMEAALKDGER